MVCCQFIVKRGELSIVSGDDAINGLADGINDRDLLQVFAVNGRLQLLMETLVAATIVIQRLCPPFFLFGLHVILEKVELSYSRIGRGSSECGVVFGEIEDIPGVLRIPLGTRDKLVREPCASGRCAQSIGLVVSIGSIIELQVRIVCALGRLVG